MKKIILLAIILIINNFAVAQKDTIPIIESYNLPDSAFKQWWTIDELWMNTIYYPCLKTNNLKLTCDDCDYIYIDAVLRIDSNGKLFDLIIEKENICWKKATEELKNCFFGYFWNLEFPKELRNKNIRAKLGTGLKC